MDGALGGVEQAGDLFGIAGIRREEPHGDRGAGLCLGFTALGVVSSRVSSSVFPSVSGALGLVFLLPWVCLPVSVCRSAVEVLCACDVVQALFECVRHIFWEQDFSLI